MKKLLFAIALFMGVSGVAVAQTKAPSKTEAKKAAVATTTKAAEAKTAVTATTATTAQAHPVKANGTPDMRYKANKETEKVAPATGPVKKDGTPDMRYKSNKAIKVKKS